MFKTVLADESEQVVIEDLIADELGRGLVLAFATSGMIALMQNAHVNAIRKCLKRRDDSVGIEVSVEHVTAIPVGMRVWAPAEAITMKKRFVTFRVEARDKEESRSVRAHMSVRLLTKRVSGRGLCKK